MYSLYQAWLLRENSSLASSTMVTIPDTIIHVGTDDNMQKFSGHKIILSSQSGYLRSLLATQEAAPEIYITNVNAEIFGILLTFMYTGYLNINTENIYSVLLATHLLHMPRALDLCRSFLIEQQTLPALLPPTPTTPALPANIIKPIPSRKLLPAIIQQQKSQPHQEKNRWDMSSTVFHPVQSKPIPIVDPPPLTINTQQPSTSKETNMSTSVSSLSPCLSNISGTTDELTVTITERNEEISKKKSKSRNSKSNEENNKVIIDVASCDGPVRFQRILNTNYRAKIQDSPVGEDENQGEHLNTTKSAEPDSKQMPIQSQNYLDEKIADGKSEDTLKCSYCDHTFKSKYCLQKHSKRHLTSVEMGGVIKVKAVPHPSFMKLSSKKLPPAQSIGSKREVRLLDMNVQYYPCKTCGSKFPSYYFVHKHRKMCHPEEENMVNNQLISDDTSKSEKNSLLVDNSNAIKTD
ncbi:unnamed protein product [Bemisia tabaci]|uniref:Uncharacterized protein n=1 Tax=Bemisia tabaci TaxID=7038 RepID=A0A9P0ADG2_BEMTA|nr:unnamed protein product [Bemisia tabaci]